MSEKPDKVEKSENPDKADLLTNGTTQLTNGVAPPSKVAENGDGHAHTNGDRNTGEDPKVPHKDLSGGARTRPKEPGNKVLKFT